MAKSTTVKLRGTLNWAKVFEENRDMEGYQGAYEDCEGAYTVNIQLDEENYEKLKATGSPKAGKKVGGEYDVKFIRKHADPRLAKWPEMGGAPGVYNEKGEEWDFDIDGVIPNGSTGTVLLQVYPAGRTFGSRILKIQVLERGEMSEGDNFLEKPANKTKVEEPKAKTTNKVEDKELEDDDIPF